MAKEKQEENSLAKQAKRIGFEVMLADVNMLLTVELTEAQKIMNEEMKDQILKHLEELR